MWHEINYYEIYCTLVILRTEKVILSENFGGGEEEKEEEEFPISFSYLFTQKLHGERRRGCHILWQKVSRKICINK